MENLTYTELEQKVINKLTGCDQYDDMPYLHIDDLQSCTGIPMVQLRGVLASLSQKDAVNIEPDFFRKNGGTIIFLRIKNK